MIQTTRMRKSVRASWYRRIAVVSILVGMSATTPACQATGDRDSQTTTDENGLRLVYVANAGVLVSTASSSVLFDALFDEPDPHYAAPPKKTLQAMIDGAPPFDSIDMVLVTHMHPDHFDAGVTDRFLRGNPRAILVAPADAVEDLRAAAPGWTTYGDRVVSLDLQRGEKATRLVGDIRVTAVRTLHSGSRLTPMNLMFLVEMDGRVVFHEGDSDASPASFEEILADRPPIDLALVHYWFPFAPSGRRALEILQAGLVGLVHYPVRAPDISLADLRRLGPPYVLLEQPGEVHSVPKMKDEGS